MSEKKSPESILNFRMNLLLSIISLTLWTPFYNLLCFRGLNKLADKSVPEGVMLEKNSAFINFLLVASIIGAPFAFYRRFQLLNNYIEMVNSHLGPLPKVLNEESKEIEPERPNCLEPKKFVGFAITTYLLIVIVVASITILIYQLIQETLPDTIWGNGAYMIFLPIGFAALFSGFAFGYRTLMEEKEWINAFNAVALEVSKN